MKVFSLGTLGAFLGLLVALLAFNVVTNTSKQVTVDIDQAHFFPPLHDANLRMAKALTYRTVSFDDKSAIDYEELEGFIAFLENSFPLVHKHLKRTRINTYSLLFEWQGKDTSLLPAMLCAHLDVVPMGELDVWTYPAFDGRISDEFIWGRGAFDDKNNVMSLMEIAESLLAKGFQPTRSVIFAFGHDEEVSGNHGAAHIATHLRSRGMKVDFVLDEGLMILDGIVPGINGPVALIGTEEKGAMSVELDLQVVGGHASMPPQKTAIGQLGHALHLIEENPMPARVSGSFKETFEILAPEMQLPLRTVMSNLWLFDPVVKMIMLGKPSTTASIRTTRAVTMFHAGVKTNVLPSSAKATVNVRIAPHDSVASVTQNIREVIKNDAINITVFDALEPSPRTSTSSHGYRLIERAIRAVHPKVPVAPSLMIGNTDTRHYWDLTDTILRFNPVILNDADLKRLHGIDERISLENYHGCLNFYYYLIRNL